MNLMSWLFPKIPANVHNILLNLCEPVVDGDNCACTLHCWTAIFTLTLWLQAEVCGNTITCPRVICQHLGQENRSKSATGSSLMMHLHVAYD